MSHRRRKEGHFSIIDMIHLNSIVKSGKNFRKFIQNSELECMELYIEDYYFSFL